MDKKILRQRAEEIKPWVAAVRRDLHMHPELGLQEERTRLTIQNHLEFLGIEHMTFEGQTAVVGLIRGGRQGGTVAIRADMDGLPIQEKNSVSYKSKVDGVMHACGHDAHMAILLGSARVLNEMKNHIRGNIKLLFQPAEETVGGAKNMIMAGCMENPKVDYVIGLHVQPYLPCGVIETRYGALNGSSDIMYIRIKGKAAHGAYPEQGTDAILIAGHVITALQSITSRNVSPLDSVALTIGSIKGGVKENVIAEEVTMMGTLRTINPVTRDKVKERVKKIVDAICASFGGEGEVEFESGYDALVNTDEVVDVILETAREVLGEKSCILKEKPSLGVEDFSYFINASRGAFYHLGCGNKGKGITAPLHSSNFDIDEDCLTLGVTLNAAIALKLLEKYNLNKEE